VITPGFVLQIQIIAGDLPIPVVSTGQQTSSLISARITTSNILKSSKPLDGGDSSDRAGVCTWLQQRQQSRSPSILTLMAQDSNADFGVSVMSIGSKYLMHN